ncbi:serine hydrolase [Brunnivagina elsteri]|nr:serine hydrolase [Calothrix elsteri]
MKQISSPPDKLEKTHRKSGCDKQSLTPRVYRISEFIFLCQYFFSQLSSRELFRLIAFRIIPAISIPIICISVTSIMGIHIVGLSRTNNQNSSKDLKIINFQLNESSKNKSKLVNKSVINIINTSKKRIIDYYHVWNQRKNILKVNITYNVTKVPKLNTDDKKLDDIVSELVTLVKQKDLPKESLSITLIDINRHKIAGYRQNIPRYPASVVKLFWMVALQEQIKQGLTINNSKINADLKAMILKSDNDASSRIVDIITQTKSSSSQLESSKFKTWKRKRNHINTFFQKSGYENINVSQKAFPISNEPNMNEPEGTELQLINNSNKSSIFNQITTYHAARLMYEIATKQAVSPKSSQQMLDLLKRDLNPQVWKHNPQISDEFNPIENFLGESLPADKIYFASKAGQNSTARHEVAYITTKDRKTQYIIAIFGKDSAYSESSTIFPDISKLVYDKMTNMRTKN